MFLKNCSFELVQAVKEDTKTVVVFQPQEILEVSDADGKWFMERYNSGKMYFQPQTSVPATTPVAEEVEASVEAFACPVCGKVAASKAGLLAHMRSHK